MGAWRDAFIGVGLGVDTSLGLVADTFETAITWDRWPDFDAEVRDRVSKTLTEVFGHEPMLSCRFTHAYTDGPAPYYTWSGMGRQGSEISMWEDVKHAAAEAVLDAGGTITHHHAVGRMHRPQYDRQRPELFAEALRGEGRGRPRRTDEPRRPDRPVMREIEETCCSRPPREAIGHGCNCDGVMGGLAAHVEAHWPALATDYRAACRAGTFTLGAARPWLDEATGVWIYNLATQQHPGADARLDAIDSSVRAAIEHARANDVATIYLPRIGAGIGGLRMGGRVGDARGCVD